MSGLENINTAAGAFLAGLATSLHCVGMCGPIACGLIGQRRRESPPEQAAALYHVGRVLSYTLVGAFAGALGRWPLANLANSPVVLLPWFLAIVLLVMALGFSVKLPQPEWLKKWSSRTRLAACRIPAKQGAFALGAITPLLPCGPLYLMLGIALVSGSALRGAEFMLAFALGTIPLLWLAQHGFQAWKRRLTPATLSRVRRGVCLFGACIMMARLWPTSTRSEGSVPQPPACPLCPSI